MKRVSLVLMFFLIFTSFMSVNAQWARTYGGSSSDRAYSIQQTTDGGYIVAGYTDDTTPFGSGSKDMWIIKLTSIGDIEWQRSYGGSAEECAYSIQQTSDDGYIVAGFTGEWGDSLKFLLLKLSATGDIEWQPTYGMGLMNEARSVQQTSDGGYIVAGFTEQFGSRDFWILKLSATGDSEWQDVLGGSSDDSPSSIKQTTDGGYIVAGETRSFGAEDRDLWALKLSSGGRVEWERSYGGAFTEYARSIQQTIDGGYIVAGMTSGWPNTSSSAWILKLSSNGDIDPNCNFINSTNATKIFTSYEPYPTFFSPQPTNFSFQDTSGITQETDATVRLICEYHQRNLSVFTTIGGTTNPSPGSYTHDYGTQVSVTAVPNSGYQFSGWSGDASGTSNPTTITMDSDKSITANFIRQYTLTIVAGTGGTTSPLPGSYDYDSGTQVSVTATASSGYQFSGWSGDASGTVNPITITMNADKSVTANFTPVIDPKSCFITTAAYGSQLHPHLDVLRDFRDKYLMPSKLGSKLVKLYYKYSPFFADLIAKHKVLKVVVRINLLPLIVFSYSMLHFGPVITAVMLAFISVVPIFLILFSRRRFKPKRA